MATTTECACLPGKVCEPCAARGYTNGLAGYAARIYPSHVACVGCGGPLGPDPEQAVIGTVGEATGPLCDDCGYWCDGNRLGG